MTFFLKLFLILAAVGFVTRAALHAATGL